MFSYYSTNILAYVIIIQIFILIITFDDYNIKVNICLTICIKVDLFVLYT